ncbi:hypothetical protein M378DRAFT_157122 [Amanita muscaria Koide BX008]|uniref:Uncharacterized protein n=1 Tax=Amanita muscaria (strain Koide BX008) TaxID=946122 RepID=A0A0C2X6C4_AMAMK|nr:hypothetical protein M378DRAFT_157122 [Amanita muscaria Koide BX008]
MSESKPPTPVQSLAPFASTPRTRLHALYSDISRQKRSNPASYHSNVDWWRQALESLVSSGAAQRPQNATDDSGLLVLHAGRTLMDCLKTEGVGKPLGLGAVIKDELQTSKVLISLSTFQNSKQSIYDPGWLPARIVAFVVGKPLWWTLEQLGVVGEDGILTPRSGSNDEWWGDYVFVPLLERAADAVIAKHYSKATSDADHLYSLTSFKKEFGSVLGLDILNNGDASILLKFLERDRRAIVTEQEVIKFTDISIPLEERQISAVDRGILELKTAVLNMQTQIDSLHDRIDQYTHKATEALRFKRKPMALNYLRSRKQLEELSNKRLNSLNTLESTLLSVEAAAGDIEIMKVYESSTATLRAILTHPSLQRESIDRTMDALAEANTDAKEVDDAVRIGVDSAVNVDQVDEDELEAELNNLIEEAQAQEAKTERVEEKLGKPTLTVPQEELKEARKIAAQPIA